jgi:hypothetical protein
VYQNSVVVAVFYTQELNFAEDLQHTHTHTSENNENFLDVGGGASLSFPYSQCFSLRSWFRCGGR